MITTVAVVSASWFDKLPAELRTILMEEADAVEKELFDWTKAQIDAAAGVWTGHGGEVIRLWPSDQAEMMRRLSVVGDQVARDTPAIREICALLKARAAAHERR